MLTLKETISLKISFNKIVLALFLVFAFTNSLAAQSQPNFTKKVNSLYLPKNQKPISKLFQWEYVDKRHGRYVKYSWYLEVPRTAMEWSKNVNNILNDYYSSNALIQHKMVLKMPAKLKILINAAGEKSNGNVTAFVDDQENAKYIKLLAAVLEAQAYHEGYNNYYTADFIKSFVDDAIPYQESTTKLPVFTLLKSGDCDCKSVLYAALLKNAGYKVALLDYPEQTIQHPNLNGSGLVTRKIPGHMAVGVALKPEQVPEDVRDKYIDFKGFKYYFAETTSSISLGEVFGKLFSNPRVYPLK